MKNEEEYLLFFYRCAASWPFIFRERKMAFSRAVLALLALAAPAAAFLGPGFRSAGRVALFPFPEQGKIYSGEVK